MKLSLERLEEIIMAKVRMAEDSLARHRETVVKQRWSESVDAIVSARECVARRDLALALLNDLKQAEQIATDAAFEARPARRALG